jgi:hypothetical protein
MKREQPLSPLSSVKHSFSTRWCEVPSDRHLMIACFEIGGGWSALCGLYELLCTQPTERRLREQCFPEPVLGRSCSNLVQSTDIFELTQAPCSAIYIQVVAKYSIDGFFASLTMAPFVAELCPEASALIGVFCKSKTRA